MRSEPADQVNRVLRGAGSLRATADQADAQLGAGAAFPEELDLGDVLRPADGDDDLADQRPQQSLAVAVGGRLRRPQPRQIPREAGQRLALGRGERRGPGVLQRRERPLLPRDTGERFFELALQSPRDEPVLRLARVELATSALGFELRAFERESLAGEARVVLLGQLGDRACARRDSGRGDRFEERRVSTALSSPSAAEGLAGGVGAVQLEPAHARVAADAARRRCRNTRPASAARSVRSAATPAAAPLPLGRRRRPRRGVSRSPAAAGG